MLNFYGSFFTLIILVDKYSPIDSHCEPSMLSSCVVKRRVVRPWPWPWGFWPWPWPCVSGLGLGLVQIQGQCQSDQYSYKHSVSRYNYTYSTLVYQRHWYRHSASPSTVWYYSVLALRLLALALALRLLTLALALRLPALVTSLVVWSLSLLTKAHVVLGLTLQRLVCGFMSRSGKRSLETISLLLAYKIKYPENFFLLRGNHESAQINRYTGYYMFDCLFFSRIGTAQLRTARQSIICSSRKYHRVILELELEIVHNNKKIITRR